MVASFFNEKYCGNINVNLVEGLCSFTSSWRSFHVCILIRTSIKLRNLPNQDNEEIPELNVKQQLLRQ